MQTHYFELRAIPQLELSEVQVMNQFMQSLHKILIYHDGAIGISFPRYTNKQTKTLGGIIRFFGEKEQLDLLRADLENDLVISDYGIIFDIKLIPEKVQGYACLSRVRQKGKSDLRRSEKRLMKQGKWNQKVKENMIEKWGNTHLNYPHCHLNSTSTKQSFILWIKREEKHQNDQDGKFNSYGLSNKRTIPIF